MIFRLSLFLLLFVGSPFARGQTPPKAIRFGEVGGVHLKSVGGKPAGTSLVSIALEFGFFKEEFGRDGLQIEQVYFTGTGPAQNEALAQGEIEFGTYGGVPNVIGLAGRIPAHIVAVRRASGAGNNYHVGVRPDSPIRAVADLKGKRIAVQKGTNPYLALITLLEANGVKEKEVTLVNLVGAEAIVAFNAGALDAVFGTTNLLVLRDQGKLRLLASTKGLKIPGNTSGLLVSDRFATAYPELVTRVIKVLTKASWWASQEENREALLRFVSERSWSYDYIKEDYEGSLKVRFNPVINDAAIRDYQALVKFAVERKLIRKEVDPATLRGWFEPRFQQAALKELKLADYWADSIGE